jgi:hypothetical protein
VQKAPAGRPKGASTSKSRQQDVQLLHIASFSVKLTKKILKKFAGETDGRQKQPSYYGRRELRVSHKTATGVPTPSRTR